MKKKLFDVIVVREATHEVVAITGKGLTEERAERREETTFNRIDIMNFNCYVVKAGAYGKGGKYP